MFKKTPTTVEFKAIVNGDVRDVKLTLRPLESEELLVFGAEHPFAFGYLMGMGTSLPRQKRVGDKIEQDYSEARALLDLAFSTVVGLEIEGKPYEGDLHDLPSVLQTMIFGYFKTLNVISQGDVSFFDKLNQFLAQSSTLQENSE